MRTLFLRVPAVDWPLVKRGIKTEFRGELGSNQSLMFQVRCPTPVVAYTVKRRGKRTGVDLETTYEKSLMLLEQVWMEPLGAITQESLRHEGFDSLAEFRRYYMTRTRKPFRPTRKVFCHRLRPWRPDDRDEQAERLLEILYGEFMP